MVKKLTGQKRAYEVQLKIKKLQADAVELTKIALNFESYMEKFMGSFQTLLGNVASVDQELSGAMKEIQQIAELAMGQQAASITMDDQSSQKVLNFLMASNLKKERLLDALEQARVANTEVDFDYRLQNDVSVTSLADYLENIQAYVQFELKPVLAAKEERQRQELLFKQEQERKERELSELRRQQEILRQQEQARIEEERKHKEREARAKKELERLEALTRLPSAKGIDYRELEQLLKTKQWRRADELTARLILKVANREKQGWLDEDSTKNFPWKDLRTINQLWVNYSDGKFGFSVQKKLWLECDGIIGVNDHHAFRKFAVKVGWCYPQKIYSDLRTYNDFMNDTRNGQNALLGSLPANIWTYNELNSLKRALDLSDSILILDTHEASFMVNLFSRQNL
ncbi:MAG: GUN4 domain-containing protein [Pseudanabaenaceae cyanobacterium]